MADSDSIRMTAQDIEALATRLASARHLAEIDVEGEQSMPVRIDTDDDGFAPLITYEDATHIVVTVDIPKDRLRQSHIKRSLQSLLAIAVAE